MDDLDLKTLRQKIDALDRDILALFEARMAAVKEIGNYKRAHNMKITDEAREEQVLARIGRLADPTMKEYALSLFQTVMDLSKKFQYTHCLQTAGEIGGEVGFQGLPGAFSEQAVMEYFGDNVSRRCYPSFEEVFKALLNEEIAYGVLPLENSFTGGITEVYDLLSAYGFYIVGEKIIRVDHNLLANPGTDLQTVREVYSHPQAFLQCSNYLNRHPDWELIPCSNTAISAKKLKDSGNFRQAVIASKRAAQLYGLEILQEGIHNRPDNCTRFIIISRRQEFSAEHDKISLIVGIAHEPGSLLRVLSHFAGYGLNMLKIESRPNRDKNWEYLFYIDFAGNLAKREVKNAVENIKKECKFFKLLGNYRSDQS